MQYYVDTYSRVDLPPVDRAAQDERQVTGHGARARRHHGLLATGWKAPEVFVAKGRDGTTDIWGVIIRPDELRSDEEVSRHREHLRRAAGLVRAEDVQHADRHAGAGRARLHRRADRRHGHGEPVEGVPRRRVEEPRRRRLPGSHPVAQGGRREVSVLRHHARRHLRHVGRRTERAGRLLFHPEFYKAAVVGRRLPRQPDGQDLVERAVDGMADRPAVRRVVERGQRRRSCRASCC